MDDLNSLIMLVIILGIACVGIFILFPDLADFLSDTRLISDNDNYHQIKKEIPNDYLAPNDSDNITPGTAWESSFYSKNIEIWDDK